MRISQAAVTGELEDGLQTKSPAIHLDHITFEVGNDSLGFHHSLATTAGGKPRPHPAKTRKWPADKWIDLGVMSIRSQLVLDQANNVASSNDFLSLADPRLHHRLQEYLLPGHPVHMLRSPWRHGWHLRVGFYAARLDDEGNILAPRPDFWLDHLAFGVMPGVVDGLWTKEDRAMYHGVPIEAKYDTYVGDGIVILTAYGFFPGQPRNSYTWLEPIGITDDQSLWSRMRFWGPDFCIWPEQEARPRSG